MGYRPNFEKGGGILPAIVQDYQTGKVLMLGYVNEEAFQKTLETGLVHFYSRSRNKLWLKGETSQQYLYLREVYVDCDEDAILFKVEPVGAVCHEGYQTCFYRRLEGDSLVIVEERLVSPEELYGKKA
ncbi:MAG: phosphoribosyl-AMP cyclohydrolase [Thermodesulfobacterium sp.]|jgi:phosphoribosyl-AMP cyclohydrolase|nr:phosphoribosyl-AMP cyclohydrolase [Thermodesulfobacterium sp.]